MNSDPSSSEHAYGWRDFDQEVVEGLVENDSRFINRRSNGWILSPLRRPLRHPARLEGRQLQEGQRPGRRPSRQLPRGADLRARAAARQHHRRARADRRSGRRHVGPRRGEPARQRDERGRPDVERAPLAAGGGSARRRRERLHGEETSTRAGARVLGTADRARAAPQPWPAARRMAPTRASTFPAGAGS